jgi:DNA replication protein DnaC
LVVIFNKAFGRWGEVLGGEAVVAMIDWLIHHAEVVALKGDSTSSKPKFRCVPSNTTDAE